MKTICLNMIVKNESRTIIRCLASIKPLIDYWVIADTGSSDGTQDLIREELKEIPEELLERPWVDFAHNRNEVLGASQNKGDYILFIDADEVFQSLEPFDKSLLDEGSHSIKALGKSSEFLKIFLASNNLPWRWQGVIHEVLTCAKQTSRKFLEEATLLYDETSGHRAQNPQKYLQDAHILEKALLQEPNHPRYLFYLGQSYLHAGKWEEALACYEKRAQLGGDAEEVFWVHYFIGCLRKDMNHPFSDIIKAFCAAFQCKPTQAEPLYRLASHLSRFPFLAYLLTRYAKDIPLPKNAARLQSWIYEKLPQECEKYRQNFLQTLRKK